MQDGVTPLLIAAHQDHVEMLRLLLGAGADVQAADMVSGLCTVCMDFKFVTFLLHKYRYYE